MFEDLKQIIGNSQELTADMIRKLQRRAGPFEYFIDHDPSVYQLIDSLLKSGGAKSILET